MLLDNVVTHHVVIVEVSVQLAWLDVVKQFLAPLKAGAHLVGKPGCNWSTTRSSGVLGVGDDVLLDHLPVGVPEGEGAVQSTEVQRHRVRVLLHKLFQFVRLRESPQAVDVVLVLVGSVIPQLPKILSQRVLWIDNVQTAIQTWNHAVLSSSLASIVLRLAVKATLVDNTVWKDLIISFDPHDKCPEGQVLLGIRKIPHGVKDLISFIQEVPELL